MNENYINCQLYNMLTTYSLFSKIKEIKLYKKITLYSNCNFFQHKIALLFTDCVKFVG